MSDYGLDDEENTMQQGQDSIPIELEHAKGNDVTQPGVGANSGPESQSVPKEPTAPATRVGRTNRKGYTPKANDCFYVEGSHETVAEFVDGVYVQQPQLNQWKKPVFVRLSLQPEQDPMVLWYNGEKRRKSWFLGPRSIMDSDAARAIVKSNAEHPLHIDKNATWVCWNMNIQNFGLCPTFNFRRATLEERQLARPEVIKVSGRQGYNRAMCGLYRRGKQVHCGKHYYRHEKQDFKIRWFQHKDKPGGKWVIDWRTGLMNDNIGAAVIREDVPEPWMCVSHWRVYDARQQSANKWIYDEGIRINVYDGEDDDNDEPQTNFEHDRLVEK